MKNGKENKMHTRQIKGVEKKEQNENVDNLKEKKGRERKKIKMRKGNIT